ncbi:hypothetical protein ACWD3I_48345 [Streptomyces sp. NPDC002817]
MKTDIAITVGHTQMMLEQIQKEAPDTAISLTGHRCCGRCFRNSYR